MLLCGLQPEFKSLRKEKGRRQQAIPLHFISRIRQTSKTRFPHKLQQAQLSEKIGWTSLMSGLKGGPLQSRWIKGLKTWKQIN